MNLSDMSELLGAPSQTFIITLLILLPVLYVLYNSLFLYLTTDVQRLPSPPLPFYKTYTIGHNILSHIFLKHPLQVQHLYNTWREELGDIYTLRSLFGEHVVIPFSETALREIQITKYASFTKSHAARAVLSTLLGKRSILLAQGNDHTRLRRAVLPAMHHQALLKLGEVFLGQGRLLADRLGVDDNMELLNEVRVSTFAVILETCLGKDAAPKEVTDQLMEAYIEVFQEPPMRAVMRMLLSRLIWFVDVARFQHRQDLRDYLQQTIYKLCKENSGKQGDTLLAMMEDETTGTKLDDQERVDTVLTFLVAGQVTTSLSVSWTLYLLAKNPEWQERLVVELTKWKEADGLSALDELPLLNNVVKESLRLYPPVLSVPRTTAKPVVLDGCRLAEGTPVRIPVLAMHRSQQIWGLDVDDFNPDRFLNAKLLSRTKMFWCPFLFGPKGCIGQRFALLEIKAFIAQIVKRKRVFINPLIDPPPTIQGPLCTPKGLMLYFEKRT